MFEIATVQLWAENNRTAKQAILSLTGWARRPQEQTGLGFVFAFMCLCEHASGGVLQRKRNSQQCTRRAKQMSTFSFFHVDRRASICSCSFTAGESVHAYASCEHSCFYVLGVFFFFFFFFWMCASFLSVAHCSSMVIKEGSGGGRPCLFSGYKCQLTLLIHNHISVL